MSSSSLAITSAEAVEAAKRNVRFVAYYLLVVGLLGLLVAPALGLSTLLTAGAFFVAVWLLQRYCSRLVAYGILAAAVALLGRTVWGIAQQAGWPQRVSDVTGLIVVMSWCWVGVQAVRATHQYHSSAGAYGSG